jgi:hypothetical protein
MGIEVVRSPMTGRPGSTVTAQIEGDQPAAGRHHGTGKGVDDEPCGRSRTVSDDGRGSVAVADLDDMKVDTGVTCDTAVADARRVSSA